MKTKFLLFCAFLMVINLSVKADDFDIMYTRLYAQIAAKTIPTPTTIQSEINLMAANGSFTDIDYTNLNTNPNWRAELHFYRLLDMALAYKVTATGNTNLGNTVLKDKIKIGLLYWYNLNPQPYPNFYSAEIHNIVSLRELLLLMKNEYTGQDYTNLIMGGCNKYLVLPADYNTSTYKNVNANCIMYQENLLYHAIIEKDATILQQAIANMIGVLKIQAYNKEGLQVDGSFLVHGLQLYNSGYGLGITVSISYWIEKTTGLSKAYFTQPQFDMVRGQLLNGDQWMLYGNVYDFGTMGRQFLSSAYYGAAPSIKDVCVRMIAADAANAAAYQKLYDHINSGNGSVTGVVGNRNFYRADYMSHRRPGKFIGIKMCSARTIGTECIGQNFKGFWMPMGATCMLTNAVEFPQTQFSYWDYTKIPGVTNPAVQFVWAGNSEYNSQKGVFVGGVSDGVYGAAAMDLIEDSLKNGVKVDILARKSWFMFDDEMVALGADITSTYAAAVTTTTLNQSRLNGTVSVNGTVVPGAEKKYTAVSTIYHDNIGYVFRTPTDINMKTNSQSGTAASVTAGASTSIVSGNVFKVWLDHGAKPTDATYEYIVLPNKTAAQVTAYSTNTPLSIVNTRLIQAVTHKTLKITEAVFYSSTSGALVIENGPTITANYPCALIIDRSVNPLKITIADPSQYRTAITVNINYGGGKSENMAFTLPTATTGNMGGSSVTKTATVVTTAINDVKLSNTSVYPNPSNGQFTIKSDNTIKNIEIYNVLGMKIKDLKINSYDNISLNLGANYPDGIYVLNVNYLDKTQEKVSIIKKNK